MKKTTVLNAFEHNLKKNILAIELEASIYRIIIGIYLYSLPIKLFIFSFIYLFIYLFIFLSHLFSILLLTYTLPIYHFLSPLSQSILYYLLFIHFVISLCLYFAPTYIRILFIYYFILTSYKLIVLLISN